MQRTATICPLLLLFVGCKDPYTSPYQAPATGYLVVEGYISGNTTTQFTLTRTIPLPGDSTLPTVNSATVQVETSNNAVYPLTGQGNGLYLSPNILPLSPQQQYRLRININNGEEYLSDLVPFKPTPAIDSISWVNNNDNSVQIYANTHDPANNTRYYQWNYTQTYEYHSADFSQVYYDRDTAPPAVVYRPDSNQIYRCWTTSSSSAILIGSSSKLAQDVIYEQPLKQIPPGDVQTSVLYSILVQQYALTADGYTFLTLMQKNSESLGTIFDAQPTQLTGNIHCLTTPTEQVIGYVSAGTIQQQRLWIYRSQVQSNYIYRCPMADTLLPLDSASLVKNFGGAMFTPIEFYQTLAGEYWLSNYTFCLDCRMQGGTNKKPSYWPN